jgi:ABC-type Fe3+-siderophore transport system permease subunit
MQGMAWLFFVLMALVLLFAYLAIRRQWFAPGITSAVAVVVTIVLMVLTSLGQGNSIIQAVIVGIVVGGMFSGATLGIAWYFHSSEVRQQYPDEALNQQTDESG